MKDQVLKIIKNKIDAIELKQRNTHKNLIVDTIDVVALKEVYNQILKVE